MRDIITLLESERSYNPALFVWKELVCAAVKGAQEDESRWSIISKVFKCLAWSAPGYCPDLILLQHGLNASKALNDPELASDLIWRAVINSRESIPVPVKVDSSLSVNGSRRLDIPFMDFAKAMNICVSKGDVISCRKILTAAKRGGLSNRNLRALYLINLKIVAHRGDAEASEKLIFDMLEKSLEPESVLLAFCCCMVAEYSPARRSPKRCCLYLVIPLVKHVTRLYYTRTLLQRILNVLTVFFSRLNVKVWAFIQERLPTMRTRWPASVVAPGAMPRKRINQ